MAKPSPFRNRATPYRLPWLSWMKPPSTARWACSAEITPSQACCVVVTPLLSAGIYDIFRHDSAPELADQRPGDHQQDDGVDHEGDRPADQAGRVAVGQLQGHPGLPLGDRAEDDADDEREDREAEAAHREAEETEQ